MPGKRVQFDADTWHSIQLASSKTPSTPAKTSQGMKFQAIPSGFRAPMR